MTNVPLWAGALAVLNSVAFLQMALDKRKAIKGKARISEAQLLLPILFGGLPGLLLGMAAFHHKTAKKSFQLKAAGMTLLFIALTALAMTCSA